MKNLKTAVRYFILSIIIVFASISFSDIYAQSNKLAEFNTMEDIVANYGKSLNSENHGVRMCTVEYVGRFNMSNFESKLIEMLNNEQNTEDKKIIALSLFQLGTLKAKKELRNSFLTSTDNDYKEFCSGLLEKCKEYDKLKTEYFETLVVNMLESK
ncbi:MAG: hypothetical protein KDC90_12290 [Ignavibacteriae bacterium]|nr:hypothetical protein [Ignavibacteriota bacterium]